MFHIDTYRNPNIGFKKLQNVQNEIFIQQNGRTHQAQTNITLETFCCLSRKNFRSIFSFFERFKFSFYNHALLDVHNLRHIPVKMFFFFFNDIYHKGFHCSFQWLISLTIYSTFSQKNKSLQI